MDKFNKLYNNLIKEQQLDLWKLKNKSIIEQGIIDWVVDDVIKPVGDTLGGVGQTITGLGKGDLKQVGNGLLKTVTSPVKLVGNVVKAPVDAVQAGIKMMEKPSDKAKEEAQKIPQDQVKKAAEANSKIKQYIQKKKLDMQQQRLLIFNTGLANTLLVINKKYADKAKQSKAQGGNKLDDNSKQMLKILIQAMGDQKKAKETFIKFFKAGRIPVFNSEKKKVQAVQKAKFDADPKKYIDLATKLNGNKPEEAAQNQKLDDNKAKMLQILGQAIDNEAKAKQLFDKYLKRKKIPIYSKKKKKIIVVPIDKFDGNPAEYIKVANNLNPNADAEATTEAEDEKNEILDEYKENAVAMIAKILNKDEDVISTRMQRRIKKGKILVLDENNKVQTIEVKDFMEKHEQYEDRVSDKEKADQKKAKDDTASKEKAEFKAAAQKLQDDLPAAELAKAADGNGDNQLKPPAGINMYNIDGKKTATWDRDEELDNDKDIEAWRAFLNTGYKDDKGPAHPRAIARALSKALESGETNKVNWKKMGNCKELYQTWIDKANAVADKFKKFDLDIK